MSLAELDATAVRGWFVAAAAGLLRHREEIDELNVYPVPDGDTGTNLSLTMDSLTAELTAGQDLAATWRAAAHGALMGARGNSGVILAQLVRGLTESLGDRPSVGPADLVGALGRAADLAYGAVAEPVEGTVLTVARAAADAAALVRDGTLTDVVRAAASAATEALARTPLQLEALAKAGVVDAGGRGLCVVLDALLQVVTGEIAASAPALLVPRDRSAVVAARESGSDAFAYEVQYLLDADEASVTALRDELGPLGDSLVVVGSDGLWNVHVHVNDVGAAVEAGVRAGRPHRITVSRFADQMSHPAASTADATMAGVLGALPAAAPEGGRAVVAVVPGPGLAALFAQAGAHVVNGGPTINPSTRELLDAVVATGAHEVVLLPNDGNVHGCAQAAARAAADAGIAVHVVPTRSPVQGLSALAVHDPDRVFADDAIGMTTAAASTRWAEVTIAVREAQTSAGRCREGDVLGLIEGDVAVIGHDVGDVAAEVADRMLVSGGELVTVIVGAGAADGLGAALAARVTAGHPMVEADVHDGGQPHYPVLLGVE